MSQLNREWTGHRFWPGVLLSQGINSISPVRFPPSPSPDKAPRNQSGSQCSKEQVPAPWAGIGLSLLTTLLWFYLTSCFLGSRMFNNLSAYTFLEAVNRMIWGLEGKKSALEAQVSGYNLKMRFRGGVWQLYLINLRHPFQELSEERP